jgi:CysZ protein
MNTLISGLQYPFRALRLLQRHSELWGYVLWPVLLNLVVGATIYIGLLLAGFQAINTWIAGLPEWAAFLGGLLQVLLVVLLLIVTGFVLVRFGVVLGSPFYGQLSERLEAILTNQPPPSEGLTFATVTRDIWRALGFELKKLLLTLAIGLPILLLNLIPAAGQVLATIGGILLGALIACLDFFDSPLERRRLGFRQKLGAIRGSFPASGGFGLICLALSSIPLINLLAIPLCVAAGTLFYSERLRS